MPHGITRRMNNIPGPITGRAALRISKRVVVAHDGPNRDWRRRPLTANGVRLSRFFPKDLQREATNVPYVNPARDLKRHRRLRAELRA